MKNHSIKIILFLVAFAVGTIAAFLFLQKKLPQFEARNSVDFVQNNEPEQAKPNQSTLTDSLSFNGLISGCGNFIAYRATEDNTKVIAVVADRDSLKLGKLAKTFEIGTDKNFEVFLYDFGKDQYKGYAGLCFDAIRADLEPVKLTATSGKANISISSVLRWSSLRLFRKFGAKSRGFRRLLFSSNCFQFLLKQTNFCLFYDPQITRARSKSKFARPYICRFRNFSRLTCPSVCP